MPSELPGGAVGDDSVPGRGKFSANGASASVGPMVYSPWHQAWWMVGVGRGQGHSRWSEKPGDVRRGRQFPQGPYSQIRSLRAQEVP